MSIVAVVGFFMLSWSAGFAIARMILGQGKAIDRIGDLLSIFGFLLLFAAVVSP